MLSIIYRCELPTALVKHYSNSEEFRPTPRANIFSKFSFALCNEMNYELLSVGGNFKEQIMILFVTILEFSEFKRSENTFYHSVQCFALHSAYYTYSHYMIN